ncbi:MAG: TolC family protein [Phycisphaeraceae bacterium]|nr:TolC family protein [Phycisphaeraceae bacterium]
MPSNLKLIAVSPLLLLTACSSSPYRSSLFDLADRDFDHLDSRERSLLARAEPARTAERRLEELPSTGSAEAYVRLALERNPSIQTAQQRVLRLRERVPQATSLNDPMLQIAPFGEMAETAAGQVGLMTSLSQRLPFPGKLDARGRVAEQDVAIAEQDLERVRLSVIADTRRSYWSLYFAVRSIEITRKNRDLLTQLREVAQAKYRAGTTTQQAVLRASVELNNLENELITLEQRRATAVGMLNTMIDRPVRAPLADPAPVTLSEFGGRLDDLLAGAERNNPSIRGIRERIERFREQRELARLGRSPDLTVSVSYNLVDDEGLSPVANGNDQWWLGFGVNLPIWQGKLDSAEREATRGILEAAGMLASEQNLVAFRVQDSFLKVDTRQRQAVLLRDVIVPEARQTVEASLSGYRAGEVDFLTLVDNWRKLLDFELMYQANLTELERGFAELEEAVGHDLNRDGTPSLDRPTQSETEPYRNTENER